MAPLDGYYFHNENCTALYTVLCQLDADNGELQKQLTAMPFMKIIVNDGKVQWMRLLFSIKRT